MPTFHAFTGYENMVAFHNKEKLIPFKPFLENERYQPVVASLTDDADIFIDQKINTVQEFSTSIYCIKYYKKANDRVCVELPPENCG